MTIGKLQQFLAVCQFQSVTRAAEFLHISQPSVSGTIRELEHEFQVNLFRHEGRRLVLTAEEAFCASTRSSLSASLTSCHGRWKISGTRKTVSGSASRRCPARSFSAALSGIPA